MGKMKKFFLWSHPFGKKNKKQKRCERVFVFIAAAMSVNTYRRSRPALPRVEDNERRNERICMGVTVLVNACAFVTAAWFLLAFDRDR